MENKELNEVYDTKEDLDENYKPFFRLIKDEYVKLVDYLSNKLLKPRVEFEKACENTEYSLNKGLYDLDIILQYSLVELAYKYGNVSDEILESIEGMCWHGSLLQEIRATKPYFSWVDLNMMENEEVGNILKSLAVYIDGISRDFCMFFAYYFPEEDDLNFVKNIEQKMNDLINAIYAHDLRAIGSPTRLPCLTNAIFRQFIR